MQGEKQSTKDKKGKNNHIGAKCLDRLQAD
jgi:hypothetical protein